MNIKHISAYNYNLPKELIAQNLKKPADTCKLLYCKISKDWIKIKNLIFKDILNLLNSNDILFFNNSKVVKARIIWGLETKFYFLDKNETKECKNCEILFLKKINYSNKFTDFEALVRPGKKFKKWRKIKIINNKNTYNFEIIWNTKTWRIIRFFWWDDIYNILEKIWKMPLPPYIEYNLNKEQDYQPVSAKKSWSVAAPTASLHFTSWLLKNLNNKWIEFLESTLHIWIWTFKTVDVDNIDEYNIHSEIVEIPVDIFDKINYLKNKSKNIVSVWTTATRILESLPYIYNILKNKKLISWNKFFDNLTKNILLKESLNFIENNRNIENNLLIFNTKLYIYPSFKYKIVDKLITNFHLPKSSLLMLVAAFMGYNNMIYAYNYAIENKYKFFSFWDAMFIELKK